VTNTRHFHSARHLTPSLAAAADTLSPPQRGCRPGLSLGLQALFTIRFVLDDEPDDDPDDDEFGDDDEDGEGEEEEDEDEENDDEDPDTETWQVSSLEVP
jgi:hypothetical protein